MSNTLQPHELQYIGFPVLHQLQEAAQTHVHLVGDAIQPSHPLSSLSPPAFNLSQPSGSFPMSQLLASGVQSIGASASALLLWTCRLVQGTRNVRRNKVWEAQSGSQFMENSSKHEKCEACQWRFNYHQCLTTHQSLPASRSPLHRAVSVIIYDTILVNCGIDF